MPDARGSKPHRFRASIAGGREGDTCWRCGERREHPWHVAEVTAVADEYLEYPMRGRPINGVTRVRIYETTAGRVALVTELARNPGMSITNAAEVVYPLVRQRFAPLAAVIEHYPEDRLDGEQFDRIVFAADGAFVAWQHLAAEAAYEILGGAPTAHAPADEPAWLELAGTPEPPTTSEANEQRAARALDDAAEQAWLASIAAETRPKVTYRGVFDHGGAARILRSGARGTRPLWHYVRHSPSGFAWGYGGSGPAEAARCILADALGSLPKADKCYQAFKAQLLAGIPQDRPFEIARDEVRAWYASYLITARKSGT